MKGRLIALTLIVSTAAASADNENYNRGSAIGIAMALVEKCGGKIEMNEKTVAVYFAMADAKKERSQLEQGAGYWKTKTEFEWYKRPAELACTVAIDAFGPESGIILVQKAK
jgi:hypothetical protein